MPFRTPTGLIALVWLLLGLPLQAQEPSYQLKVVTDRTDAIYETGESAKFQVTLTKGDQPVNDATVTYVVDDFITDLSVDSGYPRGELQTDGNSAIEVRMLSPGFLRCEVTFVSPENEKLKATAGAGFSPTKIEPSLPVPDDFDEFWTKQKALLAEVPAEAKLTPVTSQESNLETFDVEVASIGGVPVSGYFSRPKGADRNSLPAILWVHGAGVSSSSMGNAEKGAVAGMLSFDINAHGILNGQPATYYQELNEGRLRDYRVAGREDRETCYFRGMFLRLVRAIDFLTSQSEWDGKTVIVIGHSQGGGQALAAGGLDHRVTMIAVGVPAICDHSGRAAGRINGWPKLVPLGTDGKPDRTILEVARYFDGVNFASRSRAEAIMSVGFIDSTCPPSSCYAAFNQLQGMKHMIAEPLMAHAAPQNIQDAFFEHVLEHVRRQTQ
jgi:cephalosporin-C deacetylase